ncbi:hypothetical protein AK812_SmicGene19805 [Symbiodinium microadriaticum]|uniref:EF-hand domain-containing protein n=1 Tax=Symbiodinium microadriaticum TaxID=2951 RepID=A0A1Q9DRM3_SYMMI|nr:hypothetical protein AK812_SmicGene19805 [Symbiodinium microadriaticum]
MGKMAPQTERNALTSEGYYDPARIEVILKAQLAEMYGIITNYNKKTVDFCMHHYETCKQAQLENHELRTRMAVMKDTMSTKSTRNDAGLQSLMSKQHAQATKLLVRRDQEARSAVAENAVLRERLVYQQRNIQALEEYGSTTSRDQLSLCEVDTSPTGRSAITAPSEQRLRAAAVPMPAFGEGSPTELSLSKSSFGYRGDLVEEIKLPNQPVDEGVLFRSDSEESSESNEDVFGETQSSVRRRSGVLDMKRRLQQMLAQTSTSALDLYHTTGYTQRIARHPWFDIAVMSGIFLNCIWLGIDAAWNDSDVLIETDPIFLVVENLFCLFFVLELSIRFGAYKRKLTALKDIGFVVDLILVILMVLEIWLLAIIQLATLTGNTPSTFNPAFLRLTRVFKFFRMVRLVRLLRYTPEIVILVKGLGVASRSVFFTLCLLGLLIYVYGIAFKHLCKETEVGKAYFSTLSQSMFTLFFTGCFFDGIPALAEMMFQEHIILGAMFMSFLLMAPLTVLNMLVGVLVQVLQVLSQCENDALTATFLRDHTIQIVTKLDSNNDGNVDIEEFSRLVKQPGMVKALHEADIDVTALVSEAELLFNGQEKLSIDDFVAAIQAFRRTNSVTIKDLLQFRRMLRKDTEEVLRHQNKTLQKSVRKATKHKRLY